MLNKRFFGINGILAILLSCATTIIYAQEDLKNLLVDGIIWKNNGDSINGKLIYLNQFNCQFNISMADTAGNEIANYSPKDILGFCYSIRNDTVEFFSMVNPKDMGRIFMRRVYNGKLKLYQFLEINYKSSTLSFYASYYLWNNKWIEPAITQEHERESLLFHFSDCPELEYKIKIQQYMLKDIKNIMAEYEQCKLTDDYEFFYE